MPGRSAGFRLQMLIVLGFLSILMVALAAGALSGVTHIRGSAHEAMTVDARLSQLASEIATQTLESRRYEKDFFLNIPVPSERSDYLAKWQTSSLAIDHDIAAFAASAITEEDRRQATTWRAQFAEYDSQFRQIAALVDRGAITTPQAANAAFTPYKEHIRILAESSIAVANRKAALARAASVSLDAIGARTAGLIGLLVALALVVTTSYGITDLAAFRSQCSNCDARLPFQRWFGDEHYCRGCELARLAQQIDDAEAANARDSLC
jgi:hypothetical protein